MKDYYEVNRRKKASYLYYGLITAAFAGFTIVWGILSAVRREALGIVLTCFIAAAFWVVSTIMSLYVFYDANRATLKSDNIDSE